MTRAERYDVVVVGGGSAGVAAAAGAVRSGARTLLVERYGFLGGAATHSGVLAYCGLYAQGRARGREDLPSQVVRGIAGETLGHLADLGIDVSPRQSASTGNWVLPLNPEALKIALDRTAKGVEVALHTMLVGAAVAGGRIEALTVADPAGRGELSAGAFIDATGDCNLAQACRLPPSPLFGSGHVTAPASFPIRITGIDADLVLDRERIVAALAPVPAGNGRASLRRAGSFVTRLPGTDDLWWLVVDVTTDGLDGRDMTRAEQDGRELAWAAVAALRLAVPGFERANVGATGPQLGLRETRHVESHEDVREEAASAGIQRPDGIARAGWPMEIHHAPGRTEYRAIGGEGYFHVPLGALRAVGLDNLWLAGRTIGADPAAFASVRVMGTAFATGHAAGIAAALQAAGASWMRRMSAVSSWRRTD